MAYGAAAFALIVGFGLVFPRVPEPLRVFRFSWRFLQAFSSFSAMFPAIALSAIAGSFGFSDWGDKDEGRFSASFMKSMRGPLLTAIAAAGIYALIFLFAQPLARDAVADMEAKGNLFKSAASQAEEALARQDWREASRHLGICERVWADSPETEKARDRLDILLASARAKIDKAPVSAFPRAAVWFPGITEKTTATEALLLARRALSNKRPYDAHWLATLAERIARSGSPEKADAARIAADSWNEIASTEPSAADKAAFSIYKRKRDGYAAILAEDWIRAYYIYESLAETETDDPDVARFFGISERGARTVAFFADEVGASLGDVHLDVLLSLPGRDKGRDILRIRRLHPFADAAYGEGLELLSFDAAGKLQHAVSAPFVKAVPLTAGEGEAHTALLLLALDRDDERVRWEPTWTAGAPQSGLRTRVVLETSYERIMLAVHARRGVEALSVPELDRGVSILAEYGFSAEIFRAEMLRRFVEPFAFLSLAVFVLAVAWRSRAPKGMGVAGIPVLALLPFALDVLAQAYRSLSMTSSTVFAAALPIGAAIAAAVALQAALLLIALVFLAGQRS